MMRLHALFLALATLALPAIAQPEPAAAPADATQLRAENSPPIELPPLALNATTPSAAANCKNDRGMVVCETRNPNGIFVDIHPHATTVDFYIDVYLSECGLDGVKYYAPFSVSQESRRYTTHRFNQATIVHWNWRPLRPCWQAFVKDCKVGNQSRPCNQVLDVNGVLVP